MIMAWIAVAAYIAVAVYIHRRDKKQERYDMNAAQMQEEIKALARCAEDLEKLDSMIIDLRLCKPGEVQRAFRMEWQSVSGKNHSFDFMADGENESTEHMIGLAESERDGLNQEIIQRVFDLYKLAVLLTGEGEKP